MTQPLLCLTASAFLFATSLTAQYQIQPEDSNLVRMAIEHGLDSVDFPGFVHAQKHGVAPASPNTSFRLGPDQNGVPLFIGNPGFESADFTSWTGMIGDNTINSFGPLQNLQPGIFTGQINPSVSDNSARHSIMQLPGAPVDPVGNFPSVPSGFGNCTALLGNNYAQYQGQSIEQTWTVQPQDTAFVFSYAVVMYDGSHPSNEACYFKIEILDSANNQIMLRQDLSNALPPTYQAATPTGTFFLPWETDTVYLSAHIGTQLKVRFTSSGCIYGGHFCYAYVDCDPGNANTIGISEHTQPGVSVFPNPSADGVFFVNQHANTIETMPIVYDMAGRIVDAVCTQTVNGWTIDISHSAPGAYVARISTTAGVQHCNLIH